MEYNNDKFIEEFLEKIKSINPGCILFVCSKEYDRYGYRKALDTLGIKTVSFTEFEPCPEVSSVDKSVELFSREKCDFIVAVGGGSAIDVAKAIKYFAKVEVNILAIPTTAGTGAEVTRFSVLYKNGDKNSVRSYDIIPEYQVFDYTTLKSLPRVQKIVTGLDAFSHAVEAYWSKDATKESRAYSAKALELFKEYYLSYIDGDESADEPMMKCSELAGRAINIAQTTACHAFSYKLHKIKGFYHGQAVAVCLVYIWRYMQKNVTNTNLQSILSDIEKMTGYSPDTLEKLLSDLGLLDDLTMNEAEFDETVNGVDATRLSNHPVAFTAEDIKKIYRSFIKIV